jgi:hypothetical protein
LDDEYNVPFFDDNLEKLGFSEFFFPRSLIQVYAMENVEEALVCFR